MVVAGTARAEARMGSRREAARMVKRIFLEALLVIVVGFEFCAFAYVGCSVCGVCVCGVCVCELRVCEVAVCRVLYVV